jgi:dynein heavy chain 1
MNKIAEGILLIFAHLNKKLRISPYPIKRALLLVEAISRDVNDQLLKVLSGLRLMNVSFEEFTALYEQWCNVFQVWDDQVKEFTSVARDMTRKRSEKFIPIKVSSAHTKLQERLDFLYSFRKQHEQLHSVFTKALSSGDSLVSNTQALDDINLAYERVKHVEVLDLSTGPLLLM